MGGPEPFASPVGEVRAANDFYDYEAKYNNVGSQIDVPAKISEKDSENIRNTAVKAFNAMGCEGLARIDFFLCEDGTVILNEINTLPGHTSISMYPMLMKYAGISY